MNSHSRGTTQIALFDKCRSRLQQAYGLNAAATEALTGRLPFSPRLKSDLKRGVFTGLHQTTGSLKKGDSFSCLCHCHCGLLIFSYLNAAEKKCQAF